MTRDMWNIDLAASPRAASPRHDAHAASGRDWDEFGRSLRELYAGVVAQPLPASFASLLNQLDTGEGESDAPA
jgi:hypothetical protein